jgi:DNA-binding cell septation regulator SpoVG
MEPPTASIPQAAPKYHVRILSLKPSAGGNLKAFVDVQVGTSLTIYGFRLIQQSGQKPWISAPQRTWTGDDGKPRYAPILELKGELKREVEQAILSAWEGGAHAVG